MEDGATKAPPPPESPEWPHVLPWLLGFLGWVVVLIGLEGVDDPQSKELYGLMAAAWLSMAIGMPFTPIATKRLRDPSARFHRAFGIVSCVLVLLISVLAALQNLIDNDPLPGGIGYAAAPVGMVMGIAIGSAAATLSE